MKKSGWSAHIDAKSKKLVIEIDLCAPHPSGSGKTTIRATTGGNKDSEVEIDGKTLVVSVNAYTRGVD